MKIRALALALIAAFLSVPQTQRQLCGGFLPENDLKIHVGDANDKGLDRKAYDQVLDAVQATYGPIVAARGGVLDIQRAWEDATVNAMASRSGNKYIIKMFGGLARHETITQDGFAIVACHELGHHIGGLPKTSWAANEGQSDYFANLKCLRRLFLDPGAASFTRPKGADPIAEKTCAESFAGEEDRAVCVRGAMAGVSVAKLFQVLRKEPKPAQFDTPDPKVVSATDNRHPGTQCRLDTYYQGSLCRKAYTEDVSESQTAKGTCTRSGGDPAGFRPLCWYKPPQGEAPELFVSRLKLPETRALQTRLDAMKGAL